MSLKYSISKEIFSKFPEYCRGVVTASGISNGDSPDDLLASLRTAESTLGMQLTAENVPTHPKIESWRAAYRLLGVKPSEYRPSVEALLRRVIKKDPLPSINRIVDFGNLLSIQNLVPIGAHAIDVLTQDIELRFATGQELFEPFGSEAVEHPLPAEVIFTEGMTVLTRRWTWRQAKHTLVLPETTSVEFNVDGLPPVYGEDVRQICEQVAALVQKYCGGQASYAILNKENPSIQIEQ
jgi:DNA/RNA-binding domain of Phe-tRNA-synthetase-like protein